MANSFKIIIDDVEFDHSPAGEYSPEPIVFGSERRVLDASLSSQFYKVKYRFTINNLTKTNWTTIMRIFSKRSKTVTYRDSTYIYQNFNGDGTTTTFYLNRLAYSGAVGEAYIDDTLKSLTYTAATNPSSTQVFLNNASGIVTCGVAATDDSDNVQIYYQPIYQVKLINPNLTYLHADVRRYEVILEEV